MNRGNRTVAVLAALLVACLSGTVSSENPPEAEQATTPPSAEIRGTVLNPQDEPVPGATVRLRRVRTAEDRKVAEEEDADSWRARVVETSDGYTLTLQLTSADAAARLMLGSSWLAKRDAWASHGSPSKRHRLAMAVVSTSELRSMRSI